MSPFQILIRLPIVTALLALASCGPASNEPDATGARDVRTGDATGDLGALDAPADAQACVHDIDCDDHLFCNGTERCIGSVCSAGSNPCEDNASCTTDSCSETARMCTHTPNDAMCGDMNACDGIEHCAPASPGAMSGTGCQPVVPTNIVDCDDGNTCTLDNCDVTVGCVHAPRDLDGDGHVDRACTVDGTPTGVQGDDCDDSDPTVYPGAPENCTNGRDDNCNGLIDFADTAYCHASNDTCASAQMLPGPGMYTGSTGGLRHDYALSCESSAAEDVVYQFTLAMAQDVTISTTAGGGAISLLSSCSPLTELRCATGTDDGFGDTTTPTMTYHGLAAGTYQIVVTNGMTPGPFSLTLSYAAASPPDPTYIVSSPTVAFVDICTTTPHRSVLPNADDESTQIPETTGTPLITVPFQVRLYSTLAPAPFTVCSNGWMSLTNTPSADLSGLIPDPADPNLTIAPFWTDLETRAGGICYGVTGTAPNRKFVVEWNDAELFGGTGHLTYEVIINEAATGHNNIIDLVYQTMTSAGSPDAAGIENSDGSLGTTVGGPFTAPRVVRLTPMPL